MPLRLPRIGRSPPGRSRRDCPGPGGLGFLSGEEGGMAIGASRPAGSVVLSPSSLLRSRGSGSGRKSRTPSRGGGGGGGRKSRTRGHRLPEGGGGTAPGALLRPPPPARSAGQQFQCYSPPPLAVPSGAAGADGGSWDRPRRREGRSDREEGGSGGTEGGRASAPAPAPDPAPAPPQFCMDGGAEAKTGADGGEGWIHKAAAPEGEVVQQEDDDEEVEEDGPRSARRSKEPARREGRGPTADADPPEPSGEDPRESEGGKGQPRPTTSLSRAAERGLKEAHRNACGYLKCGKVERALRELESILTTLVEGLGDGHGRVASALHNLGVVHVRAGNLDDAADALEEAVRIRRDMLREDHPRIANSLTELGIVLLRQGQHEDSLNALNEALVIRERDLKGAERGGWSGGDMDACLLQVASVLNNIGCVYFEFGAMLDARQTFADSLEMQREVMLLTTEEDGNHDQAMLSVADTLSNLGLVHMENLEWEEALGYLSEAYRIQNSNLDVLTEVALNTHDNLAYSNYMHGRQEAALGMYEEILLAWHDLFGENAIECAVTRTNIACVLIKQGDYKAALGQMRHAEKIERGKLGKRSRRLQTTQDMIDCIQFEMMRFPWERTAAGEFCRYMCGDEAAEARMDPSRYQPARPECTSKTSSQNISFS